MLALRGSSDDPGQGICISTLSSDATATPDTDVPTVARYFATYNLVSLPVVDADDHLLWAITVDDLIDHMLPEDWRDSESAS